MNGQIRFGIAGCGMIAEYHAKAIAEVEGAVLTGACSKTAAHAQEFAQKYSVTFFESYEQMLASDEIDAVSICTPSGDHFSMAMAALVAGKHVVVEKPMCLTMENADRLIEQADRTGLTVCAISQSRFSDAAQAIHAAVENGDFGKLVSASLMMRYSRTQAYYDQAQWRGTVAGDGGGVLMNQGIHGIDLMCFIMGQPVSVCGCARTALRNIEVEDTAGAVVKFDNGAIGVIDATVCSEPAFAKKFIFCGEKGTVILEDDAITLWSLKAECPVAVGSFSGNSSAADPRGIKHTYHAREYRNLMAHLTQGVPLVVDARQGRMPLSVILGLYEASETEKTVKLN